MSVPVREIKPEGTRITVENADATPEQQPDQARVKNRHGQDAAV